MDEKFPVSSTNVRQKSKISHIRAAAEPLNAAHRVAVRVWIAAHDVERIAVQRQRANAIAATLDQAGARGQR
jgi:hypothetical protein